MTDSLADRFPWVVILVALLVAAVVIVERVEQAREHRREMDRAADAHRAFLEQLGRGTGDH